MRMWCAAFATRDGDRMTYALRRATEELLARRECVSGGWKAAVSRAAALALRRLQQATRRGGDDGLRDVRSPMSAAGCKLWTLINFLS